MSRNDLPAILRRLLQLGSALVAAGALFALTSFGMLAAVSVLVGGAVGGANLAMVGRTAEGLLLEDPNRSKQRVLAGFFLRLLLILFALHAMIRLHFLHAPAAVVGFVLFHCSIFVEGILQAFGSPHRG